ncbi:uncharacterized protein N7529_001573 [Penicillium soppii]|uniref:uncharacterized protein n=1 Tax=Penicillium soppii TaxID=69789 RepID=UPI00254671D9|nr:uncharacterized protein N7529_001573 [Penicillium soppii]KAJ5875989.1 hypothetical protein N7529_001573 [Penicillium soppii]
MKSSVAGSSLSASNSEWKLVNSGTRMARPLRGAELIVRYAEHYRNGDFQLVIQASIDTPLTCEQLKKRSPAAWWRTRRAQPIIALDIDMEQASFAPHNTSEAAKRWASQSCFVATNTSVEEVANTLIRTPSNLSSMTLIVDPARGPRGCILNISHTLISLSVYDILHEFITQLSNPENERGIDAIFSPDFLLDITPRLPQSLSHAYSRIHNPSPEDLQAAMAVIQRSQARFARSTIGVPIHADWKNRPSNMHNERIAFEPSESRAAFKCFKKLGITLSTAFFACMTSAAAQMFGKGDEEGAHLLFSGNGRRWVDLGGDGHGPVLMSILPGGLWVEGSDVDIRAKDQDGLAALAKAIGHAQAEDLVSPHIIALYDQMAPALVKGMAEPVDPAPLARLTLTSQGIFGGGRELEVLDPIRMSTFLTGGRCSEGLCFALSSFKGELLFNMLFDERFFVPDELMQFGHAVAGLFKKFVGDEMQAKL